MVDLVTPAVVLETAAVDLVTAVIVLVTALDDLETAAVVLVTEVVVLVMAVVALIASSTLSSSNSLSVSSVTGRDQKINRKIES